MPAAYPSPEALEEAVDLYKDEIDMKAVYAQLVDVAENYPDRTREFALVAAAAVAKRYCKCTKKPEPFDDKLTVAEKRKLAAHPDHPGLCGKEMVEVIVSVRTEAVEARGGTTGNRFRNQACYDGSIAMNARGAGVQLHRRRCYAHACRALFPGNEPMHAAVVAQFQSSTL